MEPNVTASLVIGGYDSSRCLTNPIISADDSFELTNISLNVSSGGSAFLNSSSPSQNLLEGSGATPPKIDTWLNPGVPYMYLPKDTCDAIAAHLPVTYNSDFNFYLWNTNDPAYKQIITSPHYLSFTFAPTSGAPTQINVPFALLNLTLESPLMSQPTSYFPCSPWTVSSVPYHLGRSFLQAAFLAQNWQTKTTFLAQAPGPDFLSPFIKTIESTDSTIVPATNPPDWESTWSSTLKALPDNASSSSNPSSTGKGGKSSGGLSGGAIAGIVIGVVAGLAIVAGLVFWLMRRRRQPKEWPQPQGTDEPKQTDPNTGSYAPHQDSYTPHSSYPPQYHHDGAVYAKMAPAPVYEAEANTAPLEADSRDVRELPADESHGAK